MESGTEGPCLPWCFTYYRMYYVTIGVVIGLFVYHLYLKSKKKWRGTFRTQYNMYI